MAYKSDNSLASSSTGENIANSITHGIGFGLSIAGLVILIIRAVKFGTGWHLAGFLVFGISVGRDNPPGLSKAANSTQALQQCQMPNPSFKAWIGHP